MNSKIEPVERWSYSKITPHCLYSWYKTYRQNNRGEGNCFSEYGLIFHEVMKEYAQEKMSIFELKPRFDELFKKMPYSFPPNKYVNLRSNYLRDGLAFLDEFNGFNGFEILETEEKSFFELGGYLFVGIPDLILQNKDNREILLKDYKSAKPYVKKDFEEKVKQLYLYAPIIKQKYGKYPDVLSFLHFRQQKSVNIPFNKNELEQVKKWAIKQVEMLSSELFFEPNNSESFFCNYLCGHRNSCNYKK